jgi:O-antigen ligase
MAITQKSLEELWLKALMAVLFGYALLGKEFAYLFSGEMLLLVGCVIFIRSQRFGLILSDPTLFLWGLFACWGLCRTIPFIGKWGFFAIRDAALWGYGIIAVLIVAFVNSSDQISRALKSYRGLMVWLVPVTLLLLIMEFGLDIRAPAPPWAVESSFPLLKAGDAAVHLAGAALLVLVFSDRSRAALKPAVSFLRIAGFAAWVLSTLIMLVATRGGFMAIVLAIALVSLLRFSKVGWKIVALSLILIVLGFAILESSLVTITIRGRQFSADQITANITSIFGNTKNSELEGTKAWRLGWWKNIIDYTVFGPYFWTGKGFGVNLAVEDGPPGLTAEETSLRSPHNGTMTVLARMGVPGALLWIALNITFALRLFTAYRRSNRAGLRFWTCVNLFLFSFWLAAMINLSFDVYLEGPVGGMWFWSIIGLGVAALRVQAYEAGKLRRQQQFQVAV